jgi:hypothetical protein
MQQKQQQINLDLKQTQGIVCDECQNEIFVPGFLLRKASKFLTGNAQDTLVPIQVMACASCGHVNEEFLPEELKGHVDEPQP